MELDEEKQKETIREAFRQQSERVETARRILNREEAILSGLRNAMSDATGLTSDALLLKTRDVLAIFANLSSPITKRELRQRLAAAGYDVRSSDFIPRLNTILKRQRAMKTLLRTKRGTEFYYEKGLSYPVEL